MLMRNQIKAPGSRHPRVRAAWCALVLTACALDEGRHDDSQSTTGQDALALQAPSSEQTVPDPNGAFIAEVKANGTGCPAGTWRSAIAADGRAFVTYFDAYYVSIDQSTQYGLKDCTLAIALHSPSGLSYTISDFYYEGYAWLPEGVSGRQMASYSFQGAPTRATEVQTDLVGTYDDPYLLQHTVETKNLVWSPCGLERTLHVKTVLRVTNSTPRQSGYMSLADVNGEVKSKMVFELRYRKCNTGASDAAASVPSRSSGSDRAGRGASDTLRSNEIGGRTGQSPR